MSLLKRLLIAYLVIVIVLAVAMLVVVRGQRNHLEGQLDQELRASSGLVEAEPGWQGPFPGFPPFSEALPIPEEIIVTNEPPELAEPISALFVAVIEESGFSVELLDGALLNDSPDLSRVELIDVGPDEELPIQTVRSASGSTRFRAVAEPLPDGAWVVVALPLTATDDAIGRLTTALLIGAGLVLAVLAVTATWVQRLGLRPMARMTTAAEEIAAGRRNVRVDFDDQRTEVGQLGRALNDMLDQRDETENRLRQFAADASHELRTPLTSIRGGLDLLADNELPAEQRDDVVRRASVESRRMQDLVEDLLLLASLDGGRPLQSEPVDLLAVVEDAANDALAVQPDRSIEVVAPGDDRAALVASGDEMRLRQVLSGLVHNALSHTPPDASIRIEAQRVKDGVEVSVIDNGPGMTEEQAATAFDRFSRGDLSRSRRAGGAGLGLAIAKSIIELHGGTLQLETSPNEGCNFSFMLPTTNVDERASS